MKTRILRLLSHPVCLAGHLLATLGLITSVVLLVQDILAESENPYRGILTFLVFPSLIFAGFGLVALGMLLERRRARRLERAGLSWEPVLSFARPSQRRVLVLLSVLSLLLLMGSIIGGFRAYEFTDSVTFCGQTCHEPMEPQYVAHQDSPHARVKCAECHVGSQIADYIHAKLNGLNQVWQMARGTYPRPIHAPLEKILPANKTCEHCHWPERPLGLALDDRVRFGYDLLSTRRPVGMFLRLGDRGSGTGPRSGVHWHAQPENQVLFKARDSRFQDIPWVEVRRADGSTERYQDSEKPLSSVELARLPVQPMDCLDCHNRPAHRFLTPDQAVDQALAAGSLDRSLPFIKKVAVASLARKRNSRGEGLAAVRGEIEAFYRDSFDGKVSERREPIERAVQSVQALFQRHAFPSMAIDGFTHPDNIGHREFPGCFRCHGGRHKTAGGNVLDSRCELCHSFVQASSTSSTLIAETPASELAFHPWKGDSHRRTACWTCHTGAASPYAACRTCHEKELDGGHGMQFECSMCHKPGATTPIKSSSCSPCHPAAGSAMHASKGHWDCLACHKPHQWKAANDLKSCGAPCHEKLKPDHYPGKPCAECHAFAGIESQLMGLPPLRKP